MMVVVGAIHMGALEYEARVAIIDDAEPATCDQTSELSRTQVVGSLMFPRLNWQHVVDVEKTVPIYLTAQSINQSLNWDVSVSRVVQ